jgi:hypothetical protein
MRVNTPRKKDLQDRVKVPRTTGDRTVTPQVVHQMTTMVMTMVVDEEDEVVVASLRDKVEEIRTQSKLC